jgi:hypothetical protein
MVKCFLQKACFPFQQIFFQEEIEVHVSDFENFLIGMEYLPLSVQYLYSSFSTHKQFI